MSEAMAMTTPRTGALARLVLAVAVVLALGAMLAPSVDATKKGKNTIASIKDRVSIQRDTCEIIGGGTLTVTALPSGTNITYCEGGEEGGKRCVHKKDGTTCQQTLTNPTGSGPAAPPTDGVYQEPTGGRNHVGRDTATPSDRATHTK